jgi:transposase-like protein
MAQARMDDLAWLRKKLDEEGVDLPREMLGEFAERLMAAEADALCGAEYGERSPDRVNHRNGYRQRRWDTRTGTLELSIPRLRQGSYFPSWLLEPRRRAERAFVAVVAECYVRGVSTRRVEGLVETLGIQSISKSQVSSLCSELDEVVESFRSRPLESAHYRYLWLDAVVLKSRECGRIVGVSVVIATGVNAEGRRELLGIDVITSEDGAGWTAFLRGLLARGLKGVRLCISDCHKGLKQAICAAFPGASWQRCRTHFMRNLLVHVPKAAQSFVATLVRSIFAQPNAKETWAQHGRVVEQLRGKFEKAATMLEEAGPDILAFTAFPKEHWKQIWSNNPQERLNKEVKRRTDVVGIFPNREAIIRLVGAVLTEQHDEWAVTRRYMGAELLETAGDHPDEPEQLDDSAELNQLAA